MLFNTPIKKHVIIIILLVSIILIMLFNNKSNFNDLLINNKLVNTIPKNFPAVDEKHGNFPPLEPPTIKEEIGLAMVYPQGSGVGMSNLDSNSFTPTKPGPLLTNYTIPESYGESSLSDPMGNKGAGEGARIIKLVSTGDQLNFKPFDESESLTFATAYSNIPNKEVQSGSTFVDGNKYINYNDTFKPEEHLKLQSSPGQETNLKNCDTTYPNIEKYGDFCITEGDIPYGQVVNGKVNPRLVSRWESYTGQYSRDAALEPIDGLLYPNLNVLTKH